MKFSLTGIFLILVIVSVGVDSATPRDVTIEVTNYDNVTRMFSLNGTFYYFEKYSVEDITLHDVDPEIENSNSLFPYAHDGIRTGNGIPVFRAKPDGTIYQFVHGIGFVNSSMCDINRTICFFA